MIHTTLTNRQFKCLALYLSEVVCLVPLSREKKDQLLGILTKAAIRKMYLKYSSRVLLYPTKPKFIVKMSLEEAAAFETYYLIMGWPADSHAQAVVSDLITMIDNLI